MIQYDREIKEIGVIADTHIPTRGSCIPPKVFDLFDRVELILHAGDLVDEKIIDELQALAPVEAVAGNMDSGELARRLGKLKLIKTGEVSIGLLHGDLTGRRVKPEQVLEMYAPDEPQAIVFGHLHDPVSQMHKGTLFFNPGSAIDPRRKQHPTCGKLTIEGSLVQGEIIELI